MLGSFALASFIAVVPTIEFSNLIGWIYGVVASWGVPSVVLSFLGILIAQIWMAYLNYRKDQKAEKLGRLGSSIRDKEYY